MVSGGYSIPNEIYNRIIITMDDDWEDLLDELMGDAIEEEEICIHDVDGLHTMGVQDDTD